MSGKGIKWASKLAKFLHEMKINQRLRFTNRKDQSILREFMRFPTPHDVMKLRIAEKLKNNSKDVFVEETINIAGIRCRPDICYVEDDKLNIIEIEDSCQYKNNIFKNYEIISKIANISIVNMRNRVTSFSF
jgi:hypothetical protein